MTRFLLVLLIGFFPSRTVVPIPRGPINIGPPAPVVRIALDPTDPSIVYCATISDSPLGPSSVFRRALSGRGWEELARAPAGFDIEDLVVGAESSTLFAATSDIRSNPSSPTSNLYGTADRGVTWFLLKSFAGAITRLAVDRQSGALYAGGWVPCSPAPCLSVLWTTRDQGISWNEADAGLSGLVTAIGVDPVHAGVLYAGTSEGVFKSMDGGRSWQSGWAGLLPCSTDVTTLAVDPQNPNLLFVGVYQPVFNDVGCMGLFKSSDGAVTWEGSGPRLHPVRVAFDPADADVIYAAASWGGRFFSPPPGIFRSGDGGLTWTKMSDAGAGDLAVAPSGAPLYAGTGDGVDEYFGGATVIPFR